MIDNKYIQERKEFFSVFFAISIIFVVYGLLYILNDWQWTGTSASGYCEKVSETWIREPTNTISNLAFVFVGLYILWLAQYDPTEGKPSLSTRSWFLILYGISCVAVGMGSFAMHGFNTGWGGWLDVTGMMMYISMPVFYNFSRFLRWSEKEFVSYYLGANVIFAILLWQYSLLTFLWGALIGIWISQELALKYQKKPYIVFLIPTSIILVLFLYTSPGSTPLDFIVSEFEAILLWGALAFFLYKIEDIKLERTHAPYFWSGFASYFLATIIWQPSKTDGVLCDPDSLIQGHALWHLLGAVSMWCFYKYFRTEEEKQVSEVAEAAKEAAKKAEEDKSKKAEKEAKKAEEAAKKAEEEKAKLEAAKKAEEEETMRNNKDSDSTHVTNIYISDSVISRSIIGEKDDKDE